MLMFTTIILGLGCAPRSKTTGGVKTSTSSARQLRGPNGVSARDAETLKVGMPMREVIRVMGPPLPSDQPVLAYPAQDGGFYVLFFVDTFEVSIPRTDVIDDLPLVAIIHTQNPTDVKGTYLVPKHLKGAQCSGFVPY